MKTLACILLLLIGLACRGGHRDPERISEERFARLYADLLERAQGSRQAGLDSIHACQAAETLLLQAGVTTAEYRVTVQWYNADVTRWRKLMEEVKGILQERSMAHPSPG